MMEQLIQELLKFVENHYNMKFRQYNTLRETGASEDLQLNTVTGKTLILQL
jgi:hypothetical protein